MTPNRPVPESAVSALEDLLALVSAGYTVEVVPLDLLGPDRAIIRTTSRHGEPIDPMEVRVPSLRAVPGGIRDLRVTVTGEAGDTLGTQPGPATDEARLGMMAAMFGIGDPEMMTSPEPMAGERRPDTAAMAEAIFGVMRPARVEPAATPPDDTVDATSGDRR
ncbi:MAG TPA: hypothetical protein VGT61_13700 [Thermomicrobiales bacterium]|jgi:hypothetical protein|nr:hypothetical protein [Thermomicrobiales bacterium]